MVIIIIIIQGFKLKEEQVRRKEAGLVPELGELHKHQPHYFTKDCLNQGQNVGSKTVEGQGCGRLGVRQPKLCVRVTC